ncbi:hypothetical protein HK098_001384 [Nowakowskiella sp. JEL0407]|nr:hypothetical protein HK098_001384 [Nowakowskiella sp. JEL0407]
MATIEDLHTVYESFCSFGSSRNLSSSITDLSGNPTMDGAKFAKFARDTKLIDGKRIVSTDIDIIFNKVKSKGARRIDWDEFQNGLKLIAEKRYPGKPEGERFNSILFDVCKTKGPSSSGTTMKTDGVYGKLTDTKSYTGAQKLRFDDLETSQVQQFTSNTTAAKPSTRGQKREQASIVTASSETLDLIAHSQKKQDVNLSNSSLNKAGSSSNSSLNKTGKPTTGTKSTAVFDRLTSTSGYTGTHKQRFNADGTGRGLAGRDSVPLGRNPGTYR